MTDQDIDKLLALPVRRISRFDIEKNQRELAEVLAKMEEIKKNLGSLKKYAINYLRNCSTNTAKISRAAPRSSISRRSTAARPL